MPTTLTVKSLGNESACSGWTTFLHVIATADRAGTRRGEAQMGVRLDERPDLGIELNEKADVLNTITFHLSLRSWVII